jgi:hypothetical protein
MRLDKPSSFYNYFVEQYLPASRWFVGGRMRQPTTTTGSDDPGGQDFIPGAGARVRLSRDLRMVVVRETPEVTCTTC